ncbi:DUF5812 family protein [Halovivax gelatinilyticus]|uniref:DUF5812 family protein n=1 Tax=Halovivax gelatinilyticus TaxID=2961597 RepID=UPI0020CA5C65|nr:DUF5812 family protein [Halovivax gelatinilyticus]
MTDADAITSTFVVTHADEASAVVQNVETAQVHTLSSNDDLTEGEVVDATVVPEPPLEVTWELREIDDRRTIEIVDSDLSPTVHTREVAEDQSVGDIETVERAGRGEIHVLRVEPDAVETAAAEVVEDPETVARAARLDAVRVEVRRDAEDGILSVRYLPD